MKKIEYLFDSKGRQVVTFFNGQLYTPNGRNVGHYLEEKGIFIDMLGRYLGEIVLDNRLMYNQSSPYKSKKFVRYGDSGNLCNYGSPKVPRKACVVYGYDDVMESVD